MKKIIKIIILLIIVVCLSVIIINNYVITITKPKIKNIAELKEIQNTDAIIVLGAGIKGNEPSPMLEDRLLTSIDLYNEGISDRIIVSGDHGRGNYDEVNVMKLYLIKHGIPSENIFMDHAGFSTYDSIYRAKEIFKVQTAIIVTQDYHLYRSIYISKQLDLDTYGAAANRREYQNQLPRDIREIIARVKDLLKCIIKPKPKYLGEIIPVSGNGDITNDK